MNEINTCNNCGCKEDLILDRVHIGGKGEVLKYYCYDRVACWKRKDAQTKKLVEVK